MSEKDVAVHDEAVQEPSRKRLKRSRAISPFDTEKIMRAMASETAKPPRLAVHHIVTCNRALQDGHDHSGHIAKAVYLDVPRMLAKDSRASLLRGQDPMFDVNTFMHQNDDVCMIVCKQYSCFEYHQTVHRNFAKYLVPTWINSMGPYDTRPWFYFLLEDAQPAEPYGEYIDVCSDDLKDVLTTLDEVMPKMNAEAQLHNNLTSPYDYIYHHHTAIRAAAKDCYSAQQKVLEVLMEYFDVSQRTAFDEADEMFRRRSVNSKHFGKLFKVHDIVVGEDNGDLKAFQIESIDNAEADEGAIKLSCWTWEFNGRFFKSNQDIIVDRPFDEEETPITALTVWPLRLDKPEVQESLRRRGEMFWTLRRKRLVSYDAPGFKDFEIRTSNPKYMVDMLAYQDLNPDQSVVLDRVQAALGMEFMNSDDPPDDTFVLLLPPRIKGFGFHDKKWRNLRVANMKPVTWNTKAFDRLVLGPKKKELIQALITVHLETTTPSDVIEDKGAGLIMLLHGPPGTGKTLTAESVAELAKKPLYRITCGDMGTEPERVEKYLESALYVGTMWECVVLLDEADVFLEARTQTDLVRNALVSVFLRVLEYYEGVLILTSNRVGTFDEAFKSRMQLSVHYPTLGESERRKVWQNFINALEESHAAINAPELRWEVDELAKQDLNGRQIRNTIKTARQLAAHKGHQVLEVTHLKHVVDVATDFERYLVATRGHTDEQWAAASRMRAQ